VVIAAVSGNQHELGARIVADHFALAGWEPIFLGKDSPADEVVWAAKEHGADLIALSASLALQVRTTAQLVEAVRAAIPDTKVIVGGVPFVQIPDLWRAVGADGSARDAAEAVALASRLVG
jgi:methanogenic corrinoid protein MtbC1